MDVSTEPELRGRRLALAAAPRGAQTESDAEAAGEQHGCPRYRRQRPLARAAAAVLSTAGFVAACEARGPSAPSKSAPSATAPGIAAPIVSTPPAVSTPAPAPSFAAPESDAPAAIRCLVRIYGGAARRRDDKWYLETTSGVAIPYDDGRAKSFDEQLSSPDVEDAFRDRYRPGPLVPVTRKDFDPGRCRLAPLFAATYGGSAADVQRGLVPVELVAGKVSVHRRAADALRRVAARLEKAVTEHPEWRPFFEPLGGGFNWRTVAGTEMQSAHSFGVAVDLNPKLGAYWRWQKEWQNRVPAEIVNAFESEGFAWGGRWYHFDTMHFEFRPELFDEGCYGDARGKSDRGTVRGP